MRGDERLAEVSFRGWHSQAVPADPTTRQIPYTLELAAKLAGIVLPLAALVVAVIAL